MDYELGQLIGLGALPPGRLSTRWMGMRGRAPDAGWLVHPASLLAPGKRAGKQLKVSEVIGGMDDAIDSWKQERGS